MRFSNPTSSYGGVQGVPNGV
jgi:hypothetical protein